jgi:hypothetical protein
VHRLGFEDFALPDLVLFALTRLRGIKGLGRGEKIAWSVDARFRDVPFQIALRKRGFELHVPEGTPEEATTELVHCLKKAGGIAASCLKDIRGLTAPSNHQRLPLDPPKRSIQVVAPEEWTSPSEHVDCNPHRTGRIALGQASRLQPDPLCSSG